MDTERLINRGSIIIRRDVRVIMEKINFQASVLLNSPLLIGYLKTKKSLANFIKIRYRT